MATYIIDAAKVSGLAKQIKSLDRKSASRGMEPVTLRVLREFNVVEEKHSTFLNKNFVKVFRRAEIEVEGLNPIISGYRFAARIRHGSGGVNHTNVIDAHPQNASDLDLEAYRHAMPRCEHCGKMRRRADTYILEDTGAGRLVQVGSTCLREFLGHADLADALHIFSMLTTLYDLVVEAEHQSVAGGESESLGIGFGERSGVWTEAFLALAVKIIRTSGFVSRKAIEERDLGGKPTGQIVFEALVEQRRGSADLSEADREVARDIVAWGRNLEPNSTFLGNLRAVLALPVLTMADVGYAAAGVFMYLRERSEETLTPKIDDWAGEIGQKIAFRGVVTDVRQIQERWVTTLISWRDPSGRTIKWFASGRMPAGEVGSSYQVEGTVKSHDSYRGERQTMIVRAKIGDVFTANVAAQTGRWAWTTVDGQAVIADVRAANVFLSDGVNKVRGAKGPGDKLIVFETL